MTRRIDAIDTKMIRLFEQRMRMVKERARYLVKHDMDKIDKPKPIVLQVIDKTTDASCDTEVIAYTEGLVEYLLVAARRYSERTMRNTRKFPK